MRDEFAAVQYDDGSIATVSKSRLVPIEVITRMQTAASARRVSLEQHVSVIVVANGRVVLTKEKSNEFWLPSGKIEKDESPTHAAFRELREESGITEAMLAKGSVDGLNRIGEYVTEDGTAMAHVFLVSLKDTAAVSLRDPHRVYDAGI